MKSDAEQKIANEALATLRRLRYSTDVNQAGDEIEALAVIWNLL